MKRPIKQKVIIGDSYEAPLEKYADHLEAENKQLKEQYTESLEVIDNIQVLANNHLDKLLNR